MIRRLNKVTQFWEQQKATIQSMHLKSGAALCNQQEVEEIIGYLPDLRGKNVLDLASGIGRFTRHFSKFSNHLTSVDLMQKYVEKNREDHIDCLNVTYICSDVMNLIFPENTFDFIFCNWIFLYLTDAETKIIIDRIYNWLRPEGKLFFRETCEIKKMKSKKSNYYANYRPYSYYDNLVKKAFSILHSNHIKTYVDFFSDPLQEFWLVKKNAAARDERHKIR